MRFRNSLTASLLLHAAAALFLWFLTGGRLPWRGEMVIDLTGSFRTRAPAVMEEGTAGRRSRARPVQEAPRAGASGGAANGIADGSGETEAPLVDITSLPEVRDRSELREKLSRYYPREARARGEEGVVLLEVVVSSGGRIREAKVLKSEPPGFAEAALRVCGELLFRPAYLGNRPVAVRIRLPIRFELER